MNPSFENKIRVAVLYGGRSGEHDVSLLSATNVIQYLDRSKFEVIPIGIDKEGTWFLGDDVFKKELTNQGPLQLLRDSARELFNPELIGKHLRQVNLTQLMPQQPAATAGRLFDVVFPAIHGVLCEDGTIQGLLDSADIPYVGCGVLSSAIGMDKDVSKRLTQSAGIASAPYIVIRHGQWEHDADAACRLATDTLTFPVFVKPANTGSSVGVEKIKQPSELKAAIQRAFQYDTKVLVEQGIDAIELEIAVLEALKSSDEHVVSVVGEVRPNHEFYSYAAKYLDENGADLLIPADVPADVQEQARQVARDIFVALECEGMARVDLFLERGTNKIYFNEVNTIPGFTQISMYPKLMGASGVNYPELLTHLVMLALARHERKSKLSREFVCEA